MISFLNPDTVHAPPGAYTHTARVGPGSELLYLSGQIGMRRDGSTATTLAEQAEQAFGNIVNLLTAHGFAAADIVKLTIFIVAGHDIGTVRRAREKHLGGHRPASTAVFVSQLADPAWFVEVEAVAARAVGGAGA